MRGILERGRGDREAPASTPTVAAATLAPPPWTWSWVRWQPGEGWTFFWIVLIHAVALLGLVLFPLPGWGIFLGAYALMWLGGMGTTVGYHRALAHRSLTTHPAVEFVLITLAIFNGSGSPATWTANHRLHHARADKSGDISSPRLGGFWWSHLRWLWQSEQGSVQRWAPDLDSPFYRFWTRWQIVILGLSLFVGLPFGWAAFFWFGAIRLVFSLHAQCFVNSIAHMKQGIAAGEDSSQNIFWLAPLHSFQGENWHGNHHARPGSARLGWTWKQVDVGWWVIVALEKVRLAKKVQRPRARKPAAEASEAPTSAP